MDLVANSILKAIYIWISLVWGGLGAQKIARMVGRDVDSRRRTRQGSNGRGRPRR